MRHEASRPAVSVCMPSYNHARFLPAAIESVLAQSLEDLELLIVDDASNDDSLAVAESYARRYPRRVGVYAHEGRRHLGISETANLALARSRGAYWTWIGSDDVYLPAKLETQVAFLSERPGTRWVYSCAELIDGNGEALGQRLGEDLTGRSDPLGTLLESCCIPAPTVLTEMELIREVGSFEPDLLCSDWELWIRMLARTIPGFIEHATVLKRRHGANAWDSSPPTERLRQSLELFRRLRSPATAHRYDGLSARHHAQAACLSAQRLFALGDQAAAGELLSEAFVLDESLGRDPRFLGCWLFRRETGTSFWVSDEQPYRFVRWTLAEIGRQCGEDVARHAAEERLRQHFEWHAQGRAGTGPPPPDVAAWLPRAWRPSIETRYLASARRLVRSLLGPRVTRRLKQLVLRRIPQPQIPRIPRNCGGGR